MKTAAKKVPVKKAAKKKKEKGIEGLISELKKLEKNPIHVPL